MVELFWFHLSFIYITPKKRISDIWQGYFQKNDGQTNKQGYCFHLLTDRIIAETYKSRHIPLSTCILVYLPKNYIKNLRVT